ncbi:phosphoesterase-domain-containing protein, partial [Saitoella complicata NRRL Y-17804]
SPASNVTGAVFDRFIQIWLENTDFARANGTSDLQTLVQQGILLTNYFAITHPSLPNYVSAAGGDYFGIGDDNLHHVPANVSTVVDILEERGISWGEYQEDMPYAGYTSYNYANPADGGYVDYVRKHNPLVNYDSVANNASRLLQIKNLTSLYTDLSASTMPQWSFITPNMKNDGHDTTINYAANWTKTFLTPLLNDTRFNAPRTLIVLTFDESETYADQNRVFTLLLGSAVPESLHGTTDDTVYTHYSSLATIENNWSLYHLGRGDVNASMANVFDIVASKTNYSNIAVDESSMLNNQSGPGALSATKWAPIPKPNMTTMGAGGRGVLPSIKSVWGNYSL